MANYYLNDDGSLTTKKNKKGKNYILQENGSLILNDDELNRQKQENNNTFFKKGAFDDGYQFGDVTKTVASTAGDVTVGLGKGIFRLGEGLGDAMSYGVADIQELTGNKTAAEETRERTKESITDAIFNPAADFVDKNSVLGNKSESVAEGLGYVAGITAISVITAGAGSSLGVSAGTAATIGSTAATFTSSYGHGVTEALNDGATMDEARIYGAISGAAEAGSELMFGGFGKASEAIGLSKGALDDVFASGLTKKIKNRMVKTIVQSGIKAGGEGLEEVVSGLISSVGKKVTYMKDKKLREIAQDEHLMEQFWMGALTSAIAEGPSTLRSIRRGTDYVTGRTNNEQKVYDNEVNERTNSKIKAQTIEQAYNEQIKTQENLGIEITEDLKQQIMQKIEKAYDNGTLKPTALNKKDILRIQDEVESDMQEGNISSESIMKILGENQDLSKDNLLLRSIYENEQKYNSYQVEQTDNEKVNVLMQSAADAGMNNTKKARKKVELISKLVKDTDRQYKFVSPEQLKQMGYNENANGLIDKASGEILINVHTDKGIQSIIGHETTHIFDSKNSKGEYSKEYQTLQEAAIEYAKTKGIYDSKIKSIIEAYGDLLVDETQVREELTADLVGDFLFNDEKFIENLAVKDRNIFQKLYDYIKHAYKMVKGTDEEKAFENLKHQFEKVYKTIDTNTNSNTDVKYHISENFSNEIDKSLNGEIPSNNQIKARDYTPQILVNNGVQNLPMLLTQKHLRQIIYTQQEASNLGYYIGPKDHYHGLGKENLLKAIDNLDNPIEIYKQSQSNYLVITEVTDKKNNKIIVPIQINGKGTYNNVIINENQISSVYGHSNLENYLAKNNFEKIYEKNRVTLNEGVISRDISNSNNSIPSIKDDVNTIKYSIQESENNSGSFNLPKPEDTDINQKYSMTNDTEITGDDIATKDLLKQEKNTLNEEVGSYVDNNSKKTLDISDLQEYLDKHHVDYSIDEDGNITSIENEDVLQDYLNSKEVNEKDTKEQKSAYKELQQKYKQMEIGKREYEKLLRREKPTDVEKITVDRLLKGKIENNEIPASANRQRVVDLYNAKAKFYNVEQEIKERRKEIANSYRDLAKDMTQNISEWKDKKRGIQYQVNTMKRNLRDIIPNKSEADAVYNEYFRPITKNNAIIEKEISKYNDRISKFDINNAESQYIQMIGENKYNPDSELPLETIEEFYDKNKSKIDVNKCQEAVEEFRSIYNELIVKINDTLIENGYKPIEYREGYFPHFIEDKAETILGKFAEKLGWKVNKDTLPTDIAGITDQFKPGKSWTSFSQQRRGDSTDYNALKGYDNYIRGAMDVIYHTEDIQKLRALENEIRYQYSEKGVKEKIDSIYNDNEISIEEKQQQINETFENIKNNPMGNLATELRSYTDNLANKKSRGDRSMEQSWGRQTYSVMTNIQNRVSANMVGANISSALTNFIPITQAWSQTSTKNIMKAMKESIAIQFNDDGFSENSTFLTNRTEQADRLYKTGLDKVNDKLGYMFDVVDSFTSNVIVRAKYYDNIDAGMNVNEAINNADEFAKDVMAGRSKGDMPTLFNKKNPMVKLFTAFQLEVNNQYGYMLKDLPADLGGEAKEKLVGAFVKMFLGAYLYNIISEKITGRKSAFSPIDMAIDSYETATNDDLSSGEKIVSIGEDIVGELPFIGGIAGGGRLSIQGAIPYDDPVSMVSDTITNLSEVFDADNDNKQTAINSLLKEWSRPLYYVALPFAGGQLKKSVEGLSMYLNDVPGSYANNGDLRFTIDDDIGSKIKATIFGTYANPYAQDYIDSGYKSISKDNIDEMVGLDMNSTEYREYKKGLSDVSKTTDKNGYKQYTDKNNNVYWYDDNAEIMYDDNYKKTILTKEDLTKVSKTEEALNYINDLDLTTEQKNLAANNINKNSKKQIDMSEYGNYSSYEEYKYARDYPEKYSVIKQIDSYDNYEKYKDDISDIKEQYSTDNGYKSEERKSKVQSYINGLDLNMYQKIMLEHQAGGYSIKDYRNYIQEYLDSTNLTDSEKYAIWEELFN